MAQPPPNKQGRRAARGIALGGVLSALALMVLLAGAIIPVGTFAAPVLAGICLIPVAMEMRAKWALLCYAAVGILGALLAPDLELVLFFIVICGWYPIAWPSLNKIRPKALCYTVKLLLFNAAVVLVYALLFFLFTPGALRAELALRGWWFWAILLLGGNFTFILYDKSLYNVRTVYTARIRGRLFRSF